MKDKDISVEEQLEQAKADLRLMHEAGESLIKVISYGWNFRLRETQEVIKAYHNLWDKLKNKWNM